MLRSLPVVITEEPPARAAADFDPVKFAARRITTGAHCFGCTAGAGSSCGGAVAVSG